MDSHHCRFMSAASLQPQRLGWMDGGRARRQWKERLETSNGKSEWKNRMAFDLTVATSRQHRLLPEVTPRSMHYAQRSFFGSMPETSREQPETFSPTWAPPSGRHPTVVDERKCALCYDANANGAKRSGLFQAVAIGGRYAQSSNSLWCPRPSPRDRIVHGA
jgi:hypothetical protein